MTTLSNPSADPGCFMFIVGDDGNTASFPTGVPGVNTTTAASGHTYGAKHCVVEGISMDVAGADLLLLDDAGTTITTYNAVNATQVGMYIPLGKSGLKVLSGVGGKLSTGSTARYKIYYRVVIGSSLA